MKSVIGIYAAFPDKPDKIIAKSKVAVPIISKKKITPAAAYNPDPYYSFTRSFSII